MHTCTLKNHASWEFYAKLVCFICSFYPCVVSWLVKHFIVHYIFQWQISLELCILRFPAMQYHRHSQGWSWLGICPTLHYHQNLLSIRNVYKCFFIKIVCLIHTTVAEAKPRPTTRACSYCTINLQCSTISSLESHLIL